jgi:peptidoglycan hydrolase-like protein with peptidoglycan-binding domain
MTPGQARFALTSFVFVTVGVTFNALFLQTKPVATARAGVEHMRLAAADAPGRQASPAARTGQPELRIARYAPAAAAPDATADRAGDADREAGVETVRAIQRELRLRGYGPLAGDGRMELPTRAAIMAFEQDQGLAPSGVASERLLRRMLFGVAGGEVAAGSGRARSPHAEEVIRAVQQWLAALGYQPGQVEGTLDDQTVRAIRDFEVNKGLVPRGRITAPLVVRLSEAAAPKLQGR